jgi:hypothetical protein
MQPRIVEILCLASCPHVQATIDRVRAASTAADVAVDLRVVHVETEEHAHRLRFLGSPSVRVDGRDVDPDADGREDYGLTCRMYADEDGVPSTKWIRAALVGGGASA